MTDDMFTTPVDLVFHLDIAVGDQPPHTKEIGVGDLPKLNQWLGKRRLVDAVISRLDAKDKKELLRRKYEEQLSDLGD